MSAPLKIGVEIERDGCLRPGDLGLMTVRLGGGDDLQRLDRLLYVAPVDAHAFPVDEAVAPVRIHAESATETDPGGRADLYLETVRMGRFRIMVRLMKRDPETGVATIDTSVAAAFCEGTVSDGTISDDAPIAGTHERETVIAPPPAVTAVKDATLKEAALAAETIAMPPVRPKGRPVVIAERQISEEEARLDEEFVRKTFPERPDLVEKIRSSVTPTPPKAAATPVVSNPTEVPPPPKVLVDEMAVLSDYPMPRPRSIPPQPTTMSAKPSTPEPNSSVTRGTVHVDPNDVDAITENILRDRDHIAFDDVDEVPGIDTLASESRATIPPASRPAPQPIIDNDFDLDDEVAFVPKDAARLTQPYVPPAERTRRIAVRVATSVGVLVAIALFATLFLKKETATTSTASIVSAPVAQDEPSMEDTQPVAAVQPTDVSDVAPAPRATRRIPVRIERIRDPETRRVIKTRVYYRSE